MENRAGSGERGADDETPRRLDARVAAPALAAGAVSLGLVLVGSCGLGQHDVYVTPPPLQADLQSAPTGRTTTSGTAGPGIVIPPSPTWRVAINPPAPRRTLSGVPATSTGPEPVPPPGEPPHTTEAVDDTLPATTTTRSRPTTTRPTTTRPAPSTRHESSADEEPSSEETTG
ncbi:hypothetical protein [Nocardia blacklockiae]|uniref:hypothetical protein n=1 Tax=Nocardia blacklockiae TaxID=480036 RepID=UPI00189527C5|nr:hypothetical protein [Nocardia blacklockiae]MBF6174564.1 hypothetical protein [Nocardia blacklockiae]